MTPTPHPAKFSTAILDVITDELVDLAEGDWVLDPFAGVGTLARHLSMARPALKVVGVEIEPEWANQCRHTRIGDALNLPWIDAIFNAIAVSPSYGNRMADNHDARDSSTRITYRHKLGRQLSPESGSGLQWGQKYREFHRAAWTESIRVLRPGGLFILNVSDHIRKGERVPVSLWHGITLQQLGLQYVSSRAVSTPRMRMGQNGSLRVENEWVLTFRKPVDPLSP